MKRPHSTRTASRPSMVDAALEYIKHGFAVLPLHTVNEGKCTCSKGADCRSPGKHPILNGGAKAAVTSPEEVKRLWQKHPDANIGIATGKVSGIIALDVDPRNGGDRTFTALKAELGRLPRSLMTLTGGGGSHRLFACPDAPCKTRHGAEELAGLDLQADKAFIVAPPSRHASGSRYRWRKDREPGSLSLSRLPGPWLTRLQGPVRAPLTVEASGQAVITAGGRNTHLTSRAGTFRNAGLSPEVLLAALKAENLTSCDPPLDDDEVEKIADSVGRYPAHPVNGVHDEAEAAMQVVLDQHFAGGQHLLRPSDGQFWAYDGTRWAPMAKAELSGVILRTIEAMSGRRSTRTVSLMDQVLRLMEAKVAAGGDVLRFKAKPLPVINCLNGELWIGDNGRVDLRPHSYGSYLRHRLEVAYDPQATSRRYDKAVREIFARSKDPDALVNFWHELMGYATQPDRPVPLVMLGWGSGNNGKTRLLEMFTHVNGPDVVVAMPIGDIEKSRFTTGHLLGKSALIDDDVRTGTRLPDGQLKKLSEEKTLTGENKYGPPFTFKVRTAIFMLFNNPPSLADLSRGMQRRIFVVPFDRSFKKGETKPRLFDEIYAHELPGVLNHYLAGLQQLVARGWKFRPPEAAKRAKVKLIEAANPVPAFIKECCKRDGSVEVKALYERYQEWAKSNGITIQQQRLAFGRNLKSLGVQIKHSNRGDRAHGLRLR